MGTVSPLIVANNVLDLAFREDIPVSQMKLQRLLYFIYRDYLILTGEALFAERFEAWKYGPALAKVHNEFKHYKDKRITRFYQDSEDRCCRLNETSNPVFSKVLYSVWGSYRNYSGVALSNILQQPGTAWRIAWEESRVFLQDRDIANEQFLEGWWLL